LASLSLANAACASSDPKATYQAHVEKCAGEAVRWALTEANMSDPIVVDNTAKFHHVRIEGYARHWDTRIWASVSAPAGSDEILVEYVDPALGLTSPKNAEKRAGMREVLHECLANRWPTRSVGQ
jgi:hypothetical protein